MRQRRCAGCGKRLKVSEVAAKDIRQFDSNEGVKPFRFQIQEA